MLIVLLAILLPYDVATHTVPSLPVLEHGCTLSAQIITPSETAVGFDVFRRTFPGHSPRKSLRPRILAHRERRPTVRAPVYIAQDIFNVELKRLLRGVRFDM